MYIDEELGYTYKFTQDGETIMFISSSSDYFILIDKNLTTFHKSEKLYYKSEETGAEYTYFYNMYPLNGGEYVYYYDSSYSWGDTNTFMLINKSGEVVNYLPDFILRDS